MKVGSYKVYTNTDAMMIQVTCKCSSYCAIGANANLCSEAAEEGKDKLGESKGKVLVKEIAKEGGHSVVRPATMDQEKTF